MVWNEWQVLSYPTEDWPPTAVRADGVFAHTGHVDITAAHTGIRGGPLPISVLGNQLN
jgi:hypothetical protein